MTRLKQKKYTIQLYKMVLIVGLLMFSSHFANSYNVLTDSTTFQNIEHIQKDTISDINEDLSLKNTEVFYRIGPAEDFFIDWDTSVVDPYKFDIREVTYDFPICLFIGNEDEYSLPLKSLYKTSPFGPRWGRHHKGIDFRLDVGDTVLNMFDGMVRISTYSPSFGHFIIVRHFNGLETIYAHMSQRNVESGDIIKAGECIGLGGNTGRSTGPHLHFEIRFKGVAIDPEHLFDLGYEDIACEELTIEPRLFNYLKYPTNKGRTAGGKSGYHTIRNGETLSSIARKYGTNVNTLCRLNGIKPTTTIRAGKQLRVR